MLVEDEQVSVVVESAHDKALVELPDDPQFLEVALPKHLAQLSVMDQNVRSRLGG